MSVKGMKNCSVHETECVRSEKNDTADKSTARPMLNIDELGSWLLTVTDVLSHSLLVRGGEQEHAGPVTHINLSQHH